MPNENNIHVTQRPDGSWAATREGADRASAVAPTKVELLDRAREIGQNSNAEVIVHGRDGVIQTRWSYGNDPERRPG